MTAEALLPCFTCGATLPNVCLDEDNQPYGGTEFRTYGHYGSTFWDSFDGEELVLNICDDCLRAHAERLGQHKRYLPITVDRLLVGKQWVDRPVVRYSGNLDDGEIRLEPEDIGSDLPHVEWPDNAADLKQYALTRIEAEQGHLPVTRAWTTSTTAAPDGPVAGPTTGAGSAATAGT